MKLKNILVVYAKPETREDRLTINKVKRVLSKLKIEYNFIERSKLKKDYFKNKDLIITVGGDGTFLKTSHFIKNKYLIFGVNSDVRMKEGFFLVADRKDFEIKINRIIKDKFKIKKLARLEAFINNKKIPELALNEFYIGSDKEYIASRYYIIINGKKERHKSSGILVATPAGSYAWIKSCGGKKIRLTAKKFEYVVREPYEGGLSGKYKLKRGVLKKDKTVTIISDMKKGLLVVDSLGKEYFFNKKDKIKINLSDKDLNAVFF
jgi:NAD+ kinase